PGRWSLSPGPCPDGGHCHRGPARTAVTVTGGHARTPDGGPARTGAARGTPGYGARRPVPDRASAPAPPPVATCPPPSSTVASPSVSPGEPEAAPTPAVPSPLAAVTAPSPPPTLRSPLPRAATRRGSAYGPLPYQRRATA